MADIVKIVSELGSMGLLLCIAGFVIYHYIKNAPKASKEREELKTAFVSAIERLNSKLDTSITMLSSRISSVESNLALVKSEIKSEIVAADTAAIAALRPSHPKQFLDRLKLGPQIHKTLNTFRARINADHIFIGSFHNGNESITGIPYYKFDIIAERFRPDKVDQDIEFAFMYKDADLLRHDLLPSEVVQMGMVHYTIDENGYSALADIDDIIYRRMIGRGIKQLAVQLLRDPSGTPSGFVGCVRYDYDKIDLQELKDCGSELENVYAVNEQLINSKSEKELKINK